MKYELIAFDMDGTLVVEDSSWGKIHRYFGTEKTSKRNLRAWKRGEIDYKEFMKRDIELWGSDLHISKIKKILSDYTLNQGVAETVQGVQRKGYEVAIISGGLDVLANIVATELNISHILANGLQTDDEGYLTGEGILRVDPKRKSTALDKLSKDMGIKLPQCVGVGDSPYDADLFSSGGLGIYIGDNNSAPRSADIIIQSFENFDKVLDYL